MEDYIGTLLEMDNICKSFKKLVISNFYKGYPKFVVSQGLFCYTPRYQEGYFRSMKGVIRTMDVFGIDVLERNRKALSEIIHTLEDPLCMGNHKIFESSLDDLLIIFSDENAKKQIRDKLSILKPEEISRLNEAIHCFLEDCHYSAVAMSVSAIEFRLLSLMTSVHSESNLYKMTLGQLINEYLNNKEKYGNIIPKKYEPLLEHCNTYRVFSVHPKKEKINKSVATSILHMTFQFLLDKELAQKTVT